MLHEHVYHDTTENPQDPEVCDHESLQKINAQSVNV